MAELHVRNLPAELHLRLQERAASEGRSMSAEAIVLLRRGLGSEGDQQVRERDAIRRLLDIQQRNKLPAGAVPAEQLVREDRDTR